MDLAQGRALVPRQRDVLVLAVAVRLLCPDIHPLFVYDQEPCWGVGELAGVRERHPVVPGLGAAVPDRQWAVRFGVQVKGQ